MPEITDTKIPAEAASLDIAAEKRKQLCEFLPEAFSDGKLDLDALTHQKNMPDILTLIAGAFGETIICLGLEVVGLLTTLPYDRFGFILKLK